VLDLHLDSGEEEIERKRITVIAEVLVRQSHKVTNNERISEIEIETQWSVQ
jgi:hypothetical protein